MRDPYSCFAKASATNQPKSASHIPLREHLNKGSNRGCKQWNKKRRSVTNTKNSLARLQPIRKIFGERPMSYRSDRKAWQPGQIAKRRVTTKSMGYKSCSTELGVSGEWTQTAQRAQLQHILRIMSCNAVRSASLNHYDPRRSPQLVKSSRRSLALKALDEISACVHALLTEKSDLASAPPYYQYKPSSQHEETFLIMYTCSQLFEFGKLVSCRT